MLLNLGADVIDPDGGKLGIVKRLVLNPATRDIVSVVAEHAGFDEREVVVPMDVILDADDIMLTLDLYSEDFDDLEDFVVEHNIAPPPDPAEVASDIVKDPDVPDVPPVGAATGEEFIAFTPIVHEHLHMPPGDVAVDGSTRVYATDGDTGKVKGIITDDLFRLECVVVEEGFVFTTDIRVHTDVVHSILPETIVLRIDKAALAELEDA